MSQEKDLLGVLHLPFEGKSYRVHPVTGDMELHFTNWLEHRAWEKIEREKFRRASSYELNMTVWQKMVAADQFDWTSDVARDSRNSEAGKKELLFHMLAKADPTITRQLIDRIFADPAANNLLFLFPDGLYWRSVAQARPTIPPTPAVPS
jgi:hypothetical protein